MKYLVIPALLLIGYDGLLHAVTLYVGRYGNGHPLVKLPWVLFPTFPSWAMYDLVWAIIHLSAFAALTIAAVRSRQP